MIAPSLALPLAIALPLVAGSALAVAAGRRSGRAAAWALAWVTAATLGIVLAVAPAVLAGQPVAVSWPWVPALGLHLSLRLDGLALLFAGLILGIGLLVILYARYYLGPADPPGRFYARLAFFMAAILGVVLADNLLLLAVFWELSSLASFLLIGYWQHRADAREGARMALAVTGAGGLAMLAGFLLIGQTAGSYEISAIVRVAGQVRADPRYPVALILILLGAFTKSAQFPFHFWLPAAMAAPTPVSAYLHSATLVKAGIFLIARLYPVLGGTPLFNYVVTTVGLVTFVFGAYVAVFKHDLKGLLAYSTVSHLGLITFLLGLDSPLSNVAAVFHIGNHATFKASLFMAAGIIEHEAGTRDMRRMNGLWKYMPHTGTLAIVAASAMAGVPLLNGFLSKEMFFAEALALRHLGVLGGLATAAVALGAAFSVAYSARFVHDVFFNGEPRDLPRPPHEAPRFMKVPVEVLVTVCIAVGLLPGLTVGPIVDLAARAVFGADLSPYSVALWHGFTAPLLLSALAFAGGALLYWALQRQYNLHLHVPSRWSARRLFLTLLGGLTSVAERAADGFANGALTRSLALLFGVAVALVAGPLVAGGVPIGERAPVPLTPLGVVAGLVLAAAALGCVVWHRERLVALVCSGVGGARRVARLPPLLRAGSRHDPARRRGGHHRPRADGPRAAASVDPGEALAASPRARCGPRGPRRGRRGRGGAGGDDAPLPHDLLVLPREQPAAGRRGQRRERHPGRFPRLRHLRRDHGARHRGARRRRATGRRAPDGAGCEWPPRAAALRGRGPLAAAPGDGRLGLPLPPWPQRAGGGFVAGLVTALALLLRHLAQGDAGSAPPRRLDYARVAGSGLLVAGATGVAAWWFGKPFLTSAHAEPVLPLIGALPLASATLFDLGVYLAVVGTTMLTLVSLPSASGEAGGR